MVLVPREHHSSTLNPRDLSSELTGQLSCMSTPQRALDSWTGSRARQLTKDHQKFGACSPRETHMKEPTSAHKLSSYVLLVGMPICPNAGKPQATPPRHKRLSREPAPSPRQKHLAKAKSKHLVAFPSLVFAPRVSFLFPMPHGLLAR